MNKIFNYKLENIDKQTIDIPLPARILSVVELNDDILLSSIIDDDKDVPRISVDILVIGTGEFVEDNNGVYTFLGTVKLFDGKEIWHVFYRYTDHDHINGNYGNADKLFIEDIEEFKRESPGKGGLLVM